jgi:Domain of unknown function (DUF4276)
MARLLIHVEGQTEETFVDRVLAPHLFQFGFHSVSPRFNGGGQKSTGGLRPWESVCKGITNHLRNDTNCYSTTMVDYYALPKSWPGREQSTRKGTPKDKGEFVQNNLAGGGCAGNGQEFRRLTICAFRCHARI